MPKVHTVKKARKAYKAYGIKKGDTYYWWKFRYGGKVMSKTYPKRSQLTRSDYLATLYDLEDSIAEWSAESPEGLAAMRDELVSDLETLRDEQEEKRDNMPEQLQDSGSGELLQERYDALDGAISELESIDLDDYEEPEEDKLRAEAIEDLQLDEDDEESLQDQESEINAAMERLKADKLQEWIEEKLGEIQGVSFE